MTRFLSQLTRFKFLCRFWPWKELLRLQNQCHEHYERILALLLYLDKIDPNVKHLFVDGRLFFVGVDYVNEVHYVPNPRMNWKVEGFDA
jgi:hypothetical protein